MLKFLHCGAILAISAAFSLWFTHQQIAAVGDAFVQHAPLVERFPTFVTTCLTMLALYLMLPAPPSRHFPTSRIFAFALGVALAIFASMLVGVIVYGALLVAFWLVRVRGNGAAAPLRQLFFEHGLPFAAITFTYCIFLPSVSPFYLHHSASRAYETYLSSSSLAIRNFVAANYYSFSPFTHTFWGMIQDVPTGLTSLLLAFMGLLGIVPLWEASAFFKILSLLFFATYVLAGYFLFLLLREFNVRWSIALASALVLFVGNQFYLNMVNQDMGWAGASFAGLTASLWLLAVALRRDSFLTGGWSGLALASQFYFIAPHPEMVIYAVVIYVFVALSILLITPTSTRLRGFVICVTSGGVFTLISLAYLTPMLAQLATGSMVVLGEDTTVPESFAFRIPELTFYVVLLAVCTLLEVVRWNNKANVRPALLAFLLIAVPILLLAIPGIPTAVRAFFIRFGWTVHLQPFDRLLAYVGFAALIVAALGLDSALRLIPVEQTKRFMLRLVKEHRPFAGTTMVNLAVLAPAAVLLAIVPWMVGSKPSVTIIDGSVNGVRESIEAVLANSLTEDDQRSSVPYLRARLLEFENRSTTWNIDMLADVRREYEVTLSTYGVKSAAQLPAEMVRSFTYAVAPRIDEAYASVTWLDDIPENADRYLANLDAPYVRVMAVLGAHDFEQQRNQRAFISIARNVISAHNNTMMMDTRSYVGYPSVQALFVYPRDFLPRYRPILKHGNYFINGERPPWHYETRDVLGNEFRRLLGIAGVGAYLMLPEEAVHKALERPTENLERLSKPRAGKEGMVLVRDRNAYDTAYLARVVATVSSEDIDALAVASKRFFSQRLRLDQFRTVQDPAADALLSMKRRHDAILEQGGGRPALEEIVRLGALADGPAARGGKVEIKGAIGPRVGLQIECPDPWCVVVYNLAALPGWHAYVGGEQEPILRANYGFISVVVPKGSRYVSLFYATPGQTVADWLSLLTFIGMLYLSRREAF